MSTVSELVQQYVSLGKVSSTGFHQLKCPICHDYKERMGLKLEGTTIGANCFNCSFTARYDESNPRISKNFKQLLQALGVPLDEIEKNVSLKFFEPKEEKITLASLTKVNLYTPEISLPPLSVRLTADNFPEIKDYLRTRKLKFDDYPFYVSLDKKLTNRVIIPFYRNGKIIYWQARSIDNNKLRYINSDTSKSAVIFNIDSLYTKSTSNLFVTEGVVDAISVKGVAIIGSKLNPAKIEILKSSRRELVFVLDADDNGLQLGQSVLQYNLGQLTTLGKGLDINSSIVKYGKLWTYYQLVKNITKTPFEQQLLLRTLK